MTTADSFAAIIELWPSAAELSRDLTYVKEVTVRAWKVRGIPAEYWAEIATAALARGIRGVTIKRLARLAAHHAGRPATSPSFPTRSRRFSAGAPA
jgi:hypothetical protein